MGIRKAQARRESRDAFIRQFDKVYGEVHRKSGIIMAAHWGLRYTAGEIGGERVIDMHWRGGHLGRLVISDGGAPLELRLRYADGGRTGETWFYSRLAMLMRSIRKYYHHGDFSAEYDHWWSGQIGVGFGSVKAPPRTRFVGGSAMYSDRYANTFYVRGRMDADDRNDRVRQLTQTSFEQYDNGTPKWTLRQWLVPLDGWVRIRFGYGMWSLTVPPATVEYSPLDLSASRKYGKVRKHVLLESHCMAKLGVAHTPAEVVINQVAPDAPRPGTIKERLDAAVEVLESGAPAMAAVSTIRDFDMRRPRINELELLVPDMPLDGYRERSEAVRAVGQIATFDLPTVLKPGVVYTASSIEELRGAG